MDSLTPQLHAFYTQPLSPQQRQTIHSYLLQTLTSPDYHTAAITFLNSLIQTLPQSTSPPDPFLLHHALHILETLTRQPLSNTPPLQRTNLLNLLIHFLISAYTKNATTTPPPIPPHAISKAAVAAVQLAKREWAHDPNYNFLSTLTSLIHENGHTPNSLPRIFAGLTILTTFVDEVATHTRPDLLAVHKAAVQKLLRLRSRDVLACLEVGARVAGPGLPKSVSVASVRAISALVQIEPSLAPDTIALLARCIDARFDEQGAEILGVLADMLGGKLLVEWPFLIGLLAGVLESVAMGQTIGALFAARLVAATEALVRRVIRRRDASLERLLNALMGVTTRWAVHAPAWLPPVLDTWITVLECFEDDNFDGALLNTVCTAISKLCLERCMVSTNGDVLKRLDGTTEDVGEVTFGWDEGAEMMAEIAVDPSALSAMLFVERDGIDDANGGDYFDHDDGFQTSRCAYVNKCVEVLIAVCAVNKIIAISVGHIAYRKLQSESAALTNEGANGANMEDFLTALNISYGVAGIAWQESTRARTLLEMFCTMLRKSAWRSWCTLGVTLLRATAEVVRFLPGKDGAGEIGREIVRMMTEIMNAKDCPGRIASAAALVVISFDKWCGKELFSNGPPIDANTICHTTHCSVAELGIGSLVRWAIVPVRNERNLPVRWSDAEWQARSACLQSLCGIVFADFVRCCKLDKTKMDATALSHVERGSGLIRTMMRAMFGVQGHAGDALWTGVAKDMTSHIVSALRTIGDLASAEDEGNSKRRLTGIMGALINCMSGLLNTCRRQCKSQHGQIVGSCVHMTVSVAHQGQDGTLARAAVNLIKEQVCISGDLVERGVMLAWQVISNNGDSEACMAAVSVLGEILKRHWSDFWPTNVCAGNGGMTNEIAVSSDIKRVYMCALQGIVSALKSEDVHICHVALLRLQGLHASRRIFSRVEAFLTPVGGEVARECVRIAGGARDGSAGIAEEATEVLWGIKREDNKLVRRVLEEVVKESGVNEEEANRIVVDYDLTITHGSFVSFLSRFVNDCVFWTRMNGGPVL